MKWEKLGLIIKPRDSIYWLKTYTGPSYAVNDKNNSDLFHIYITGRDINNRSTIGKILINISNPLEILDISEPVLDFGEPGTFDENGISYPCLLEINNELYMYYVGWMPTVITPFQNFIGLAVFKNNQFVRYSKAPIIERNKDDFLCFGSCFVIKDNDNYKMWYTSFKKWGNKSNEHKHYYNIKLAESDDGLNWQRNNISCIDFKDDSEYAICRPSVIKKNNKYYMWFTYRGHEYRIGFAISDNGINWQRLDNKVGIDISLNGWDSEAICYPHVFEHNNYLYMIYCGNKYGKEGLGLAKLDINDLEVF